MMKSKQFTQNLILSFIGFILILLVFWFRLLRHILTLKTVIILPLWLTKSILILFIILYVYLIYATILFLFKIPPYMFLETWFIKRIIALITLIKKSPQNFYTTIIFPNFRVVILIEKPIFFLVKLFARKPKDIIYLFFKTFPRVIVSTLFVITLFFFCNTMYFFASLFLLILPLFYNCYYYIANHLCDENIPYFCDHLIFKESKTKKGMLNVEFADHVPNYPDAKDIVFHRSNKELLNWFIYNYDVYTNIKNFLLSLQKIEDKYKCYENLYIYNCYLIGWSYLLYNIL